MNIAVVEPVGGHGGNEFYDFGLCEHLVKLGHSVILYTCDETTLDERHNFNFIVKKLFKKIYGKDNKFLRALRFFLGGIRSALHAKKNKVQLAHFHIYHFSLLELFNLLVFRIGGIKCVSTIHDVHSFDKFGSKKEEKPSFSKSIILHYSVRLIVHSSLAKEALERVGSFYSAKIRYVPHGDTDFIYSNNPIGKEQARKEVGISVSDNQQVLLFFGQIKAVKGLDVLLRAMTYVSNDVILFVVGKCWKQDIDDYLSLIQELKIEDKVVFRNQFIKNEDVPFFFWSSDGVVLPYKKIYSSGVVLRAMDYGCPVICSDLPPLKSVVQDIETGLVFESENPKALAKKINFLLENPSFAEDVKTRAKSFIDSNYSWKIVAESTQKIYEEVV